MPSYFAGRCEIGWTSSFCLLQQHVSAKGPSCVLVEKGTYGSRNEKTKIEDRTSEDSETGNLNICLRDLLELKEGWRPHQRAEPRR